MSALLLPLIPLSINGGYRLDKRVIIYVTKYNYSSGILCFTNLTFPHTSNLFLTIRMAV